MRHFLMFTFQWRFSRFPDRAAQGAHFAQPPKSIFTDVYVIYDQMFLHSNLFHGEHTRIYAEIVQGAAAPPCRGIRHVRHVSDI